MTLQHQFKKYSTYDQENNLQHHCITNKEWYIVNIVLYQDRTLKYKRIAEQ
jgi:hypothetical protein